MNVTILFLAIAISSLMFGIILCLCQIKDELVKLNSKPIDWAAVTGTLSKHGLKIKESLREPTERDTTIPQIPVYWHCGECGAENVYWRTGCHHCGEIRDGV